MARTDDFEIKILDSFEGYISAQDKTNLAPNVLVDGSINVYKKESGTIAIRPGLKRRGAADSTVAGVKSSYEWYSSLGLTYPLRVANNKLQVESEAAASGTPVWYDLLETSTNLSPAATLTRFVFDSWWNDTEKKDRVLMVRGDDKILHWSGGLAAVAAQAAGGSTLTLTDSTSTWLLKGFSNTAGQLKFHINGSTTEYTYTGGETTNTLTGITPALPAITANTVILQSVLVEDNKPVDAFKNDIIKVIGNQAHIASYTSRLVYISSSTDFTDYTIPSPRTAGSPELLTLDNATKGIGVRQGKAHISAGLSDWYVVSYLDITVGSTLTQQTIVDKQQTAALSAAYAHEFIDSVGDDIVYLSQDQQVRIYGLFRNLVTAKYPSLSEGIKTELRGVDFTLGQLRAIGDFIYLISPNAGKTYLHETRESVDGSGNVVAERFWHPPQQWDISRVALIAGNTYGHSNSNPQIYQLWDTEQWHDDSPSNTAVAYEARMVLAYNQHDRRQGLINFDKVYVEGYLLRNSDLNLRVRRDYNDPAPENNVLNSVSESAQLFPANNPITIGGDVVGQEVIGGGSVSTASMVKFRVISDVTVTDLFEYQLEIFSTLADSNWEVLAIGTDATLSTRSAAYIRT